MSDLDKEFDSESSLDADFDKEAPAGGPAAPAPEPGFFDKAGAALKGLGSAAMGELQGGNDAATEVRSALGGLSYNFAPKLAKAMGNLVPGLNKTPGELLSDAKYLFTDKMEQPDAPAQATDYQKMYAEAADKAPLANVAGALASPNPLAKVGAVGKGVKGIGGVVARAAARGVEGAGQAGLSGLGASQKDTLGGQLGDALDSAKFGGGLGAGSSVAGDIARGLGRHLTEKTAPAMAVKSITHGGIGDKLAKEGIETEAERRELGKFLLDNDMVKAFRRPDYTVKANEGLLKDAGAKAAAIRSEAQAKGAFRPQYAEAAAKKALSGLGPDQVANSAKARDAIEWISQLEPDFQKANEMKTRLDRAANFSADAPEAKKLYTRVVNSLRGNIGDQLSETLGPAQAAAHAAENRRYELGKAIENLAGDEASRIAQHNPLASLMNHGLAGAAGSIGGMSSGHASHGMGYALATEIAAMLAKGRTASTMARLAQGGGKLAGGVGAALPDLATPAARTAIQKYLEEEDNNTPQGTP